MPKKAVIKYRSLHSNLVHLPLSLYASLAQQQARPQGIILYLQPFAATSSSRQAPKAAYLGWSGLAAASSLTGIGAGAEGETLEIDPEVAMGLGWGEGTVVELSVIHNPTKAKSVSVTPLTADDWEILEQHASFLENNLLGQLRAAQKGQELNVWVKGRTKLRIRVDETNPATSGSSAVLINPDTEIFVAPRPRNAASKKPAVAGPAPTVIQPETPKSTAAAGSSTPLATAAATNKTGSTAGTKRANVRLVPQDVAATWGAPREEDYAEALATGHRLVLGSERTVRRIRRKLDLPGKGCSVVRLDRCGHDPDTSADGPEAKEEGEEEEEEEEEALECCLVMWNQVPDGCIVMPGKLDAKWEGWQTVRAGKPRGKGRKDKTRSLLLPQAKPSVVLPGTESVATAATQYLRRLHELGESRILLLLGAKGVGKTALAKSIGTALERDRTVLTEILFDDVGRIESEGRIGAIKERISDIFEKAAQKQPCLLILDNLHALLGPDNELSSSTNPSILANHFVRLAATLAPGVLMIATATSSSDLHPSLQAKHVFGETLKLVMPNKEVRADILQHLVKDSLSRMAHQPTRGSQAGYQAATTLDYVSLAGSTEGYAASDLNDLVQGSVQQAMMRLARSTTAAPLTLLPEDFALAQAAFTPISLRGVTLQKSDVKWADIGGLGEARRVLRETLEWPTKYAQIYANCPLRLASGLLLYGYPGCGKTLLASAVAKECGLNFISVKGPEILNKYIGASEKSVRDLFERASAAKPCVLFFDEFDSIAPRRGHDSTGVTDRVVNQMLTEMDGAQGLEGVYVLAATSRPDLIDPALLRPGRLDKSLICDMPDMRDRLDILQALAKKLVLDDGVMLDQIAAETEGFSGADLQAVMYNAHLEVVQASIASISIGDSGGETASTNKGKGKGKAKANGHSDKVTVSHPPTETFRQIAPEEPLDRQSRNAMAQRIAAVLKHSNKAQGADTSKAAAPPPKSVIEQVHLLRSLANTRPSVAPADRAKLSKIYKAFVADRDGGMCDGDLGRETGTRASLM